MWRTIFLVLVFACQPKQPLQPSYFNAERAASGPASCEKTLGCYAQCQPLTEECMLLCDQRGHPKEVERARAVSYCSAQHGCEDRACTDERCAPQLQACTAPPTARAPSPMQPPPVMQPQPMQPQPAGPPPVMRPQPIGPPPPPPPPPY